MAADVMELSFNQDLARELDRWTCKKLRMSASTVHKVTSLRRRSRACLRGDSWQPRWVRETDKLRITNYFSHMKLRILIHYKSVMRKGFYKTSVKI
jgi:hypothetical protein